MKEKDPNLFHLQDVLTAIQTYLEQEARGQQEAAAGMQSQFDDTFHVADAVAGPDEPAYRKSLPLLQFYFARSGATDRKSLEALAGEYFIPC
ncbi:TPA: hypothetical protein DDW35_13730 [Candidatus Sumerlaeota bacterium]|nr:hypothetical protein [Candidatus Sumerlaeota bacterium]